MLWLSVKLGSVDDELQGMLREQTESLKQKEILQKYKQALTAMKDASLEDNHEAQANFLTYCESLEGGPYHEYALSLYDGLDSFTGKGGGHYDVAIADVTSKIEEFDKDSELSMIRINQLLSQRQTAVQLAQSIMNKQNETLEGIVKKFG